MVGLFAASVAVAIVVAAVVAKNLDVKSPALFSRMFFMHWYQIIYGENKDDNSPKWIGIEEVSQLLDDLEFKINDMNNFDMLGQLNYLKDEVDTERDNFKSLLNDVYKKFYKDGSPLIPIDKYCVEYNGQEISITQGNSQVNKKLVGKYVLDLIPMIKKLDGTDGLISIWKEEIDDIDG